MFVSLAIPISKATKTASSVTSEKGEKGALQQQGMETIPEFPLVSMF